MIGNAKANRGPSAGPENRAALIAAARLVIAEHGIDAPLSAVARRAGVGQGSLYRHFPDRVALTVAVFEDNMADIEAKAAREGTTLRDVAEMVTHHSEGAAVFIEMVIRERLDHRIRVFEGRLRRVVEAAWPTADGNPTSEDVDDFMLAVSMVSLTVARTPAPDRREASDRAWRLIFAGLHAHADRGAPL